MRHLRPRNLERNPRQPGPVPMSTRVAGSRVCSSTSRAVDIVLQHHVLKVANPRQIELGIGLPQQAMIRPQLVKLLVLEPDSALLQNPLKRPATRRYCTAPRSRPLHPTVKHPHLRPLLPVLLDKLQVPRHRPDKRHDRPGWQTPHEAPHQSHDRSPAGPAPRPPLSHTRRNTVPACPVKYCLQAATSAVLSALPSTPSAQSKHE